MAKQTMKIRSTRSNVANSTEHLNAPVVPIKTALEMAMEKSGLLVNRDAKPTIDVNLVAMYERLENQMKMLRLAIHYDKVDKGLVSNVEPLFPPVPPPEPVNYKTGRVLLDTELHIFGKSKPRTLNVKAETVPADDFEPTPVKKTTTAKAATVRDDHKAGKEAFTTTFRDAVMEAFTHIKPGQAIDAHTVNPEDPTSSKYRVYFTLSHMGSTVVLERKASEKKAYKRFTVEIPLKGDKLIPEMIPAYASKK